MFRKLTMLVAFSTLIGLAFVSKADEIHLKDGRVIKVKRCWEKKDKVLFNLEGDAQLYSINKELVTKTKRTHAKSD